jgi:serine/threonine-protein kinase
MLSHCRDPIPDPREVIPGVPAPCAEIVRRAMAKDPAERFQTAAEMLAALDSALAGGLEGLAGARSGPPALNGLVSAVTRSRMAGTGGLLLPPAEAPVRPYAWVPIAFGAVLFGIIATVLIIFSVRPPPGPKDDPGAGKPVRVATSPADVNAAYVKLCEEGDAARDRGDAKGIRDAVDRLMELASQYEKDENGEVREIAEAAKATATRLRMSR